VSEKARILVCEDEEPTCEMLEEFLADEGYRVAGVDGGAALRRLVPEFRPDLVICDLKLQGEDGLSLTRWLRQESHAAVLLLTAMGSVVDRVVGLEVGADDYLAKPFEPAELRARIRAVLRRTVAAGLLSNGRPPARLRIGRCVLDTELRRMFDETALQDR
jgi:DNA-binding response OmpR family regulator